MAMQDEVDTPRLAVIGLVTTIIVLLVMLVAQILYFEVSRRIDRERNVTQGNVAVQSYLTEQEEKLHRYAWVDKKVGTAVIPIERAMQLTLQRLQGEAPGAEPASSRPAP